MGVIFLNGFPEYRKQQGLQLLLIDRNSPVWPDGKKHSRNVYAHSPEECEEKLAELIVQMKAEIAEAKAAAKQGKTVGKP